jgi:hypothetical protein
MKIYLSHPIRGPLKDKAKPEDMLANCLMAKTVADKIRQYIRFNHVEVDVDLYVPAENEEFVNRAWANDMLTIQQILFIDCQIIREKFNDLLLVFAPYGKPVEGCHIEKNCAEFNDIPVIVFKDMAEFKEKIEVYLEENDCD